ncbi:cell division cycle-associated protein 3 isoform X3 [Takifugu rubripes]|nr:cell division cycle-associated protein 3 isoform X3 [Takifugu rubripes]XP_011604209.1 cell division cycle-associated protein 3 isoform X3 [Takifugu rubripes]|eukprot:XP_011604208.1 PREDICTED: cell division cycle-associated protein 3 isoform X3 [Takifugu rubripes]
MGSTESKMAAPVKPEPAIKHNRIGELMDPRSPSATIDRTPIQIGGFASKSVAEVRSDCQLPFTDPRSPSAGISRTPIREVMRATVGSFARRLGMIFHNEAEGKTPKSIQKRTPDTVEEVSKDEALTSADPLRAHQPFQSLGSLAEHANLLHTPVIPPVESEADLSPFMLLEKPQVEVELQTEADISLEEAEEAKESPLHNRLSMSLITCREGETSAHVFAESSPGSEVVGDGVDHSHALPSIGIDAEIPDTSPLPSDAAVPPAGDSNVHPNVEDEHIPSAEESKLLEEEKPLPQLVSSPEQPKPSNHIRCPTFDPKSPSQVVFKPQWLGKGFGASGLRVKSVHGQRGKGGSSPLAVRVAVRNAANENKGQTGKRKQKGAEGRSPLQILKETNSPRDHRHQMKVKTSTPDKPRLGHMERRVLPVSVDKEN